MALHKPASSGQHRSPVCGPTAGPRPYAYDQEHEEPQGTAHAVWYDPFRTQSTAPISIGNTPLPNVHVVVVVVDVVLVLFVIVIVIASVSASVRVSVSVSACVCV